MNKYISVNKEGIKALQRTFKVKGKPICERCVKNALAFRTDNDLARKIRFAAVKHHGGCTYYNIPEGERREALPRRRGAGRRPLFRAVRPAGGRRHGNHEPRVAGRLGGRAGRCRG